MNNPTSLRVHVAPVGFEIDRVCMPAQERKADRVWLMVQAGDQKVQRYIDSICENLVHDGIEIKKMHHTRTDLFDIIRATREIINQESGNSVFVNLSSGSKIQAVGCVMACMMFNTCDNIHSYYAEPREYYRQDESRPLSTGVRQVLDIPKYDIRIPKGNQIDTLKIISGAEHIKKKDLLVELQKKGIIVMKNEHNGVPPRPDSIEVHAKSHLDVAGLASMDQHIIRPLLDEWRFLHVVKRGRHRIVSLTREGKNAARFFSDDSTSSRPHTTV